MYALRADNISKSYRSAGDPIPILRNVNIQIACGEMTAIMGSSGSGKTTLLHVLTGVDIPDSGTIEIGSRNLTGLTQEELASFCS